MPRLMQVEYLSPLRTEFHFSPICSKRWTLHEPFIFSVDGEKYEVPPAFWTDFASIPRMVWPIISPYDIGYGPIPHDFGYFTGVKDKYYWDCVLHNCMLKDKVRAWKIPIVFHAVDKFGWPAWERYRKLNVENYVIRNIDQRVFQIYEWRQKHEKRFVHWDQRLSGDIERFDRVCE